VSQRVDKDSLPLDKPRRTPGHPTKSHIVKTNVGGKEKIIRFGEQGAETAGKPKAGESDRMKQKRASFKSRHAQNIAKGKSSPAYWANKVKWAEGGEVKMAAGGSVALALIDQMRRSAAQSPEFDPTLVTMRDQRARPARRPASPQASPRVAQPREEPLPLPLPPVPPAMRPDENPPPEAPRNPMRFDEGNPHVATAISMAQRYNLPPSIFLSLVQQESRFNPTAVSSRGAIGLGQLMPATAEELGVDPRDPEQNLEGSARYLRQMLDRFGTMELALAAYNAGPGRVRQAGNTIPNIRETQQYVPSILRRAGANVPEGLGELDQKYAEGGRVGRVADMLARAFREGLAPRTRQNPRGLPMDEESRRLRAESLGFDLDNPTYHGTSADADFRAFKQKDRGVWSTRDPESASDYARDNDSIGINRNTASRVIPLVSRAENLRPPSDADMETMRMSPNYARAQAEVFRRMRAQGADAVDMGSGVQVDLDTRNLRSPHATFDPERIREADILAGLAALGVGVGANLEDLDQKYAEGGAVMSDEEYDRRLLSRMKAHTGRVTEPTRAEQMQALRTAGTSAAEGLADVLLPQSPLDAALMAAFGPGGRAARLAGSAALASLEPSEAEASRLYRLTQLLRREAPAQADTVREALRGAAQSNREHAVVGAAEEAVTPSRIVSGSVDRVVPNATDRRLALQSLDNVLDFHTHPSSKTGYSRFGVAPSRADFEYYLQNYPDMRDQELRTLIAAPPHRSDPTSYNFFATDKPSQVFNPRAFDDAAYELQFAAGKGKYDSILNDPNLQDYFDQDDYIYDLIKEAAPLALLSRRAEQGLGRQERALSRQPITPDMTTEEEMYRRMEPIMLDILRDRKFAEGGAVNAEPMPYNADAVDALVKQIEAEYV
jgi:hypothetical protein